MNRPKLQQLSLLALTLISYLMMTSCNQTKPALTASEQLDSLFTARYGVTDTVSGKVSFPNPGASVLICKGDSVLFEKSYGESNYDTKATIDQNTFFNIASVSKQFTAVAILKLYQEGKLDIESSIYDVSPRVTSFLPPKNEEFAKIKIKHLMSHTSGIMDTRPRDDRHFVLTATDMQSLEYMKGMKSLRFTTGSQYEYINPTFQLLYVIIEEISGKPFEQYMRDEIFTPAGMPETLYFEDGREIPRMSHGYVADKDDATEADKKFTERDYGEESFFATKADGGIYTSVIEFDNWEKALRDNKILDSATLALAYTPQIMVTGSPYCDYQNRPHTYYAFGWFVDNTPDMPVKIYHTGDNGGYQIYAAKYPDKDLRIMVFENRNDHSRWNMAKEIDSIARKAGWLD